MHDRPLALRHLDVPSAPPAAAGRAVEAPYYRTDGGYGGTAPYFFDLEACAWADLLRDNWQAVRREYEDNVRRGRDHVVDVFNPAGPTIAGWRSVNFQTYLWRYPRARRAFPLTVALLDSIPGLTSAFINVLEPGASIPVHQGDSQAIMRCHLGLDVPEGDCAVRVGPETRRCANGALLAFCDAHEHASWNATGARRVVLLVDVMRPEYLGQRNAICANVLSATMVIWLEKHLRRQRPFPPRARTALRRAIGWAFRLALPIQRRVR